MYRIHDMPTLVELLFCPMGRPNPSLGEFRLHTRYNRTL